MKRVLFVCIENACRSQMAEAFAARLGVGRIEAHSAGSQSVDEMNPRAIAFMAERGYDLRNCAPKSLSAFDGQVFDVVVTMGYGDACPMIPATRREDWALPDPKLLPDDAFRAVRDEIEHRVRQLLAEWNTSS